MGGSPLFTTISNDDKRFWLLSKLFLIVLPILWIVFIAVGWKQDDIIEDDVANLWIPTSSVYAEDKKYADDLGRNELGASSFLAMSLTRDDTNIFTKDRLEEIRTRMEKAENTIVEYNGVNYTWDDLCYSNNAGTGTVYQFPCLRISPMDLYQEARWFFDKEDKATWYDSIIQDKLVKPLIPRFGIMKGICSSQGGETSQSNVCDEQLALRTMPGYATSKGYPDGYANSLMLFSDISNMENNNPCKMCIEAGYEATINKLQKAIVGNFGVLALELNRTLYSTTDPNVVSDDVRTSIVELLPKIGMLAKTTTKQDVIDYFHYTTVRQLYATLGASDYIDGYNKFVAGFINTTCSMVNGSQCDFIDFTTLNMTTSMGIAMTSLLEHADHTFSSVSTAGIALPFWSDGNDDQLMFQGTSPVGGSGIDLSGISFSSMAYLNTTHYGTAAWSPIYTTSGFADPTSPAWMGYVASDPVYKWFMSSLEPMVSHCGNDPLPGTGVEPIDTNPAFKYGLNNMLTDRWCTEYNIPYGEDGEATKQHFAKMWYDLLVDSDGFLGITKGESDPYTWTTGQGCDYSLGGTRYSYKEAQNTFDVLSNSSRVLYYIDEGQSIGVLDRNLLLGGVTPHPFEEVSYTNPIQEVKVIQTIYPTAIPKDIVNRVKNCNRPNGGPLNITEDDATEILELWKEAFELSWTEGWNDDVNNDNDSDSNSTTTTTTDVQFVGFYDSVGGAIGTTGRVLRDITLDNGKLTTIAICVIAAISAIFLFSLDMIESRVLITLIGVGLVLLCFFGALGFGILVGIKINVNIAWTLPFIILGIGVDDMYIVLLALKARKEYSRKDFVLAMSDVVIPITMTSLVNASMFAIMNISDIPAIYKTAQMALIAIIFLWLTIILCYPAWCWLDFKRQAAGRRDVLFCFKKKKQQQQQHQQQEQAVGGDEEQDASAKEEEEEGGNKSTTFADDTKQPAPTSATTSPDEMHVAHEVPASFIYEKIYRPLVFGTSPLRIITHIIVWLGAFALLGVGIWGITERELGLGLEDFFPKDHQAHVWATVRTEELAAWSIQMNWADLDYANPETQMKMIKQFEDVIATPHVAELDTKFLWIADLLVWTTHQCTENFDRDDPDVMECGYNQVFLPPNKTESNEYNTTCSGVWKENKFDLREQNFVDPKSDTCNPYDGGICRPLDQMHPLDELFGPANKTAPSWCPTINNWSDEKMSFCIQQWRKYTGGSGNLMVVEDTATQTDCDGEYLTDDIVQVPILYSKGPSMYAFDLNTHDDTLDLIEETRAYCDNDPDLRCWLTGIPYDYWEQYLDVEKTLLKISGAAVGVALFVSCVFLYSQLRQEREHSHGKIIKGSITGGLLIALTILLCIVPVIGLSSLAGVSVTGFSVMSYVLSVAFSTEYSVHIVHRFLETPLHVEGAKNRIQNAMRFLTLPLTLAFISSTVGVVCLAFTEFEFNSVFFFRPLIIVMGVTYFYGVWWLPIFLSNLDCDFLKLGKSHSASYYFNETSIAGGPSSTNALGRDGNPALEEGGKTSPEQQKDVEVAQKSIDDIEDVSSEAEDELSA